MWKGFITESKSYMDYPKCGRISFWLQFPRAMARFYFLGPFRGVRDKLRRRR